MEEKPNHRSYLSSWYCHHGSELLTLGNGEIACLSCMHVVVRADGSGVSYKKPSWLDEKKPKEESDEATVG